MSKRRKVIIIILSIVALIVIYSMTFFEKKVYYEQYIPGSTHYVFHSKITGLYYCREYHACSAVDCKGYYTFGIHASDYFNGSEYVEGKK